MNSFEIRPPSEWKHYTVASVFDADAIKTSIATSASAQLYDDADLNGAIGGATLDGFPQQVSATLASNAGSYSTNPITVTGTDVKGNEQTDTLTPTDTDGGYVIRTTKAFKSVTSIAVPAQANTGGAFTFGYSHVCPQPPARRIRCGATAGTIQMQSEAGDARPMPFPAYGAETVVFAKVLDTTSVDFAILQ